MAVLTFLVQCGVFKFLYSFVSEYRKRDKAQREGHIAYYNLENLTLLYKSYKALGGNGAAEKMYNKTINLPQIEEE